MSLSLRNYFEDDNDNNNDDDNDSNDDKDDDKDDDNNDDDDDDNDDDDDDEGPLSLSLIPRRRRDGVIIPPCNPAGILLLSASGQGCRCLAPSPSSHSTKLPWVRDNQRQRGAGADPPLGSTMGGHLYIVVPHAATIPALEEPRVHATVAHLKLVFLLIPMHSKGSCM